MSTFKFYRDSASPGTYQPPGFPPFKRTVDCAALILNGGLATSSDVATSLASTGFAIADVLQVFQVSLGFCLRHMGAKVLTTDGGTMTVGNNSATQTHLLGASAAGYIASVSFAATGVTITAVNAAHLGPDNYTGIVFVTNGSIDCTFAGAAADTAKFDIWAEGYQAF